MTRKQTTRWTAPQVSVATVTKQNKGHFEEIKIEIVFLFHLVVLLPVTVSSCRQMEQGGGRVKECGLWHKRQPIY